MKAATRDRYGPPDLVEIREIKKPVPADDELLVRVEAASPNPLDWYGVTGAPYVARAVSGLRKPKVNRLGVDFAGRVEKIGRGVTRFRPGDQVFGGANGAFAEYVTVAQDRAVVTMPPNLSFEQAAVVPGAGVTALQGLHEKGDLKSGQKVLINGASGGVGTFAVQLAKAFGAEVTGVCSSRNVDLVRSIGADHVIDYTREDLTRGDRRYDLMLDVAGTRSWSECRRVLKPQATLVLVGGPTTNRFIGSSGHMVRLLVAGLGSSRKVVFLLARITRPALELLGNLLEAGQVQPIIDRRYELNEIPDALRYLGEGHARGKIVIRTSTPG